MKRNSSYEEIKGDIICRIVNEKQSRHLDQDVITFGYLDFTVVLCVELPEENTFFCLTRKDAQEWEIEIEELINLAMDNTYEKSDFRFCSLMCFIELIEKYPWTYMQGPSALLDIAEKDYDKKQENIYLISNSNLRNGACVLMYPKKLDEFAQRVDSDLIILPSSLNELIILTNGEWTDYKEISSIVACVNDSCVSDDELFSYTIYKYDKSLRTLDVIDVE